MLKLLGNWKGVLIPLLLMLLLTAGADLVAPLLSGLNPEGAPTLYSRDSFFNLILWHLLVVLLAIGAAVLVTRPQGADFLPLARAVANLGQTVPPVAVLAMAVPAVGFGLWPTLIALFLYGLLPIFENSLAGLQQVDDRVIEAARGMGMTPRQRLLSVELPLALPIILTGVRLSVIISIGTATIGSTVAAKGLGEVIIAGLLTDNLAYLLHGGLLVALLAMLLDGFFLRLERMYSAVPAG